MIFEPFFREGLDLRTGKIGHLHVGKELEDVAVGSNATTHHEAVAPVLVAEGHYLLNGFHPTACYFVQAIQQDQTPALRQYALDENLGLRV